MTNLSITVITLNEEKKVDVCLKSLQRLEAEIILVDSGSTDQTLEIAKKYKAKIYHRKFDNFANQKNFAAAKTIGAWILSVDADEIIPKDLAEEIKQAIKQDGVSGFLIGRRNFILGGEIKHSRWSPDEHIWLWRKQQGVWMGEVHEEVMVKGKVRRLKNKKLHHQQQSITDFIRTNDFYASILARKRYESGIKFSLGRFLWDPFFEFALRFFYKLGFLDGWRGFVLAYLMAIYQLIIWVKLWELEQKK